MAAIGIPYTNNAHHWPLYFGTIRVTAVEFGAAGYPVPSTQTVMRQG